MKALATEREQALRWLIANRRPDISIEQAVRVMCMALPRGLKSRATFFFIEHHLHHSSFYERASSLL